MCSGEAQAAGEVVMQRAAARRASPAAAVTAKSLSSAPSLLSLLCVLSASAAAGHLADITIDTGRRRSCRQPPPTRQRFGHYAATTALCLHPARRGWPVRHPVRPHHHAQTQTPAPVLLGGQRCCGTPVQQPATRLQPRE